jgi:hypothetical protein
LALSGSGCKLRTCRRVTPGLAVGNEEVEDVSINGFKVVIMHLSNVDYLSLPTTQDLWGMPMKGRQSSASQSWPYGVIGHNMRINDSDKRQSRPAVSLARGGSPENDDSSGMETTKLSKLVIPLL